MPENPPKIPSHIPPPPKPAPKAAQPDFDAGHVPMTEEFDSAKRTLPPAVHVVIALVVVAIAVGIMAYLERAKPAAQGGIDQAIFSRPEGMDNGMVLIELTLTNVGDKAIWVKNISVDLKTDKGTLHDEAAPAADFDRYLAAYPDLKQYSTKPLTVETRIQPGALQQGSVLVSFPVTKEQFDARKELTVVIEPYDQRPVVLRERSAIAK